MARGNYGCEHRGEDELIGGQLNTVPSSSQTFGIVAPGLSLVYDSQRFQIQLAESCL